MKPQPGLSKQISKESLNDIPVRIEIVSWVFFFDLNISSRMMARFGSIPFHKRLSTAFQIKRRGGRRLSMK